MVYCIKLRGYNTTVKTCRRTMARSIMRILRPKSWKCMTNTWQLAKREPG